MNLKFFKKTVIIESIYLIFGCQIKTCYEDEAEQPHDTSDGSTSNTKSSKLTNQSIRIENSAKKNNWN